MKTTIVLGALTVLIGVAGLGATRLMTRPQDEAASVAVRRTAGISDQGRSARLESAMKELDLIRPSPRRIAEDFTVKTVDGRSFRLSEHRGKVVFVNFWATWCPPCREEMPALERLLQRTEKDGLVMLAVSVDADAKAITPFLAEHRFTFEVGLDPTMRLAEAYGVRALPASFIIDHEGRLAALALGPREWDSAASQTVVEGMGR